MHITVCCLFYIYIPYKFNQKAAERGGYGGERYEKLEFQKKVADCYKALHNDVSWKVINCLCDLKSTSLNDPCYFLPGKVVMP